MRGLVHSRVQGSVACLSRAFSRALIRGMVEGVVGALLAGVLVVVALAVVVVGVVGVVVAPSAAQLRVRTGVEASILERQPPCSTTLTCC